MSMLINEFSKNEQLEEPDEVLEYIQEYRMTNDYIRQFIDECIEINPEGKISTRGDESINIDKKYRTWVQTQDGIKVERSVLIEYMNNHFKEYTVTKDSKNKSWKGIAIKSDEEEAIPEFIDNDEN